MPLDVHPDPDGNVVLTGKRVHFRGRLVDECRVENNRELFDEGVERYMPHHATCVAVDEFRRPAKKAKGSGDGRYHRSGFLKKFGA
jgi:hypothetical protein